MKKSLGIFCLLLASGCATQFTGKPKVEGPAQCKQKCDSWGMDLAGMFAAGEYSDGCICSVKGKKSASNDLLLNGANAAVASIAGVIQQQQEAEAAAAQHH